MLESLPIAGLSRVLGDTEASSEIAEREGRRHRRNRLCGKSQLSTGHESKKFGKVDGGFSPAQRECRRRSVPVLKVFQTTHWRLGFWADPSVLTPFP